MKSTVKKDGIAPIVKIVQKIKSTPDVLPLFLDLNKFLISEKRESVIQKQISYVDNKTLLEILENNEKKFTVIDIREKREVETLLRLHDYEIYKYIRFGDLINNNFDSISKNKNIILVGFTENREIIAASYLQIQGYKNVKILRGGLLQWAVIDKLPTVLSEYGKNFVGHKDINAILTFYSKQDIETLENSITLLSFGPFSSDNIPFTFWDSNKRKNYINSLPKDKKYVLNCKFDLYCWEATYFWYEAKDSIDIIGYSNT